MLGALSSVPSRIFFAGCWFMSGSSELSGRMADVSERLGVLSDTDDATGDERDELDADMSGGVVPLLPLPLPLLFDRAFVGSFT